MHPDKAEALQHLAKVTNELDTEIVSLKDVARNPDREGWSNSLKAAATLCVLNAGAVLADVVGLGIRSIADKHWN
jgi:hypothetical protein